MSEPRTQRKRILIVVPNWPPINLPDYHRARTALPYLEDEGWEAHILCLDSSTRREPKDWDLLASVPAHVPVTAVSVPATLPFLGSRFPGYHYRSIIPLARAGSALLATGKFQLVFFATTMFAVTILGPYWLSRHDVPYVVDWQDPWYSGRYEYPESEMPGGRAKYRAAIAIARRLEPVVIGRAAHVIAVSGEYVKALDRSYPGIRELSTVIPFGAPEADLRFLEQHAVTQNAYDPQDGLEHWVYAGRAGVHMQLPAESLFLALRRACSQEPARYGRIQVHLIGTAYAVQDDPARPFEELAEATGLHGVVSEHPARIGYFAALKSLRDADVLFILGSDDPSYTPSKIYPYVLARKPLLAILHECSEAVPILRASRAATVVTFASGESAASVAGRIFTDWFLPQPSSVPGTDWDAFAPYTARAMTKRLCEIFDSVTTLRVTS